MQSIKIPNKALLDKKIEQFKKHGVKGFHVVADFDRTLTKGFNKGRKIQSSYSYIRDGNYLTPDYAAKSYKLFDEYHPIEIDPSIFMDIKIKKMEEWWELHYSLQIACGITKEVFQDIIAKNKIEFRNGTLTFLDTLSRNNIPLLIFSAGQGDTIKECLAHKNKLTQNIHLISNFFIFDKNGKAIGYTKPLVHTFNKNEEQVKNHPYQKEIKERKNVLLLGDSVGDVTMAQGLSHNTIIKIGFLNEKADALLPEFEKHFDIIILNDGSMEEVNKIINEIMS